MKKFLAFVLFLLVGILSTGESSAQGYYNPAEWQMRRTHDACAQMPITVCQQYVLATVVGVNPYGYGYGYGYGRSISAKDAAIVGGAVVGGVLIHRHIKGQNEKKALADACVAGDDVACNQLRYRSEKDYQKAMRARGESGSRRPVSAERREPEPLAREAVVPNAEPTLRVVNETGADVRLVAYYGDKTSRFELAAGKAVEITAGASRIKATVITRKGDAIAADVMSHPDEDNTLVIIAPEVG